ncbi:hypothetical protein HAX54_029810, partial [Datura stramonium]|nr:hypothetical protein [Datura stramonium]
RKQLVYTSLLCSVLLYTLIFSLKAAGGEDDVDDKLDSVSGEDCAVGEGDAGGEGRRHKLKFFIQTPTQLDPEDSQEDI